MDDSDNLMNFAYAIDKDDYFLNISGFSSYW